MRGGEGVTHMITFVSHQDAMYNFQRLTDVVMSLGASILNLDL